ncbi:3-oxoacid CoA-transferase subunit B [Polynucleobacter necessarius]|uniref:3-oxoacid CoA-transferase subunit B n=1 Tax=Polynucleobacter necessarius TaxID=576610 RepID=UPI000E08D9EB|nr:3-oxoacid CoA-transferase subunit B [Polynucleobacter necessarius]
MIDLTKVQKRSTADIAKRIVQNIPDGAHVNLGIGQPMTICNYLPPDKEILMHSENGLLGMGPLAKEHEIDEELVNAGKQPVTMLPGASLCHHADSFVMIRGGHIDICVLGAFQVSVKGDIANWRTGDPKAIPAVGGAMDLALGAKKLFVMMEHLTKAGESKLVNECTYPLTALAAVDCIYTDLATIAVTPDGLVAIDWVDGMSFDELVELSGVPMRQVQK